MTHSISDETPAILIVDDHRPNLLALEAVLAPLGYRVVAATSGEEALRRLLETDFVLIVMDVHMPGLDGYQTTALLRQHVRSRDIPVIFLTAIDDRPEHTHRAYAVGAVDYITKPFDPEVLRGRIRALVMLYTRGQRVERERNQEGERTKALFLGAIGHDLRNPLNAIVLTSDLFARAGDCGNPSHQAQARRIARASRRMQRMIDDILDLTRRQFAGEIPLSPALTNASDLCRAVVDEHRVAHPERVLTLDVSGEVAGYWDPDRLGRVVSNLVGNAIEHGEGGPIHIDLRDRGERVVLAVHNGGAPIAPPVLSTIFEPFRRGESGADGLGLGLYIVREIVRAHQGTVEVTSTLEDGTTFTVTLPKAALKRAG